MNDPSLYRPQIFQFTLPNREHRPTQSLKFFPFNFVSFSIRFQLWSPIVRARFRRLSFGATMVMPEAAVNKNNFFLPARTISGLPGSFLLCNRYLYPKPCNSLLNTSSGLVFFVPTDCMMRRRCSGVLVSAIPKSKLHLKDLVCVGEYMANITWASDDCKLNPPAI